jgi:hypothetical protein
MELWEADAIDLVGPGLIEFDGRSGRFGFIAVEAQLDCRVTVPDGRPCVEFTWEGADDSDLATGRGRAILTDDDTLDGRIFFHLGDDSGFQAVHRTHHRCREAFRAQAPVSDAASRGLSWEQRIETALDPGRYVSERGCFAFVSDLERVAADVKGLVSTDPRLATMVYETFVAGCTEKADEVDDSSGELGMVLVSLVGGWVTARQASGARPDRTASRLLAWVDDDPRGFCHRLVHDMAEVLDQPGRDALTAQVQCPVPQRSGPVSTTWAPMSGSPGTKTIFGEVCCRELSFTPDPPNESLRPPGNDHAGRLPDRPAVCRRGSQLRGVTALVTAVGSILDVLSPGRRPGQGRRLPAARADTHLPAGTKQ